MKFKHQLSIFNALTRVLMLIVLWFLLPVLVEKVVYKHTNKTLLEKRQNFIEHLDKEEISNFLVGNDSLETFSSYSTMHSEFLQLKRLQKPASNKTSFLSEPRLIEGKQNDYRILQYEFEYESTPYLLEIGSSLSEVSELIFAIRIFILVILTVILILTFLLDTFYIENLLKPFYKIIDTKIRRVDQPDKFDHTPIKSTSADFEQLDTVLTQMMERMTDLFQKERQFIGNVSHEMLTPITLLQYKFENLLQNDSLDEDAIDKIAASLKTLDRLKKIINNLLLISRIDNNQYQADENIDFREIFETLSEDFEDRLNDRKIKFDLKLTHSHLVKGNKTLLHILWNNLLSNAIKYNKEGGQIDIFDGFEHSKYFIKIVDSGIGMDPMQTQSIFTRFKRLGQEQEGQGLGLAIVLSIAQFHQIDVSVDSSVGNGTTFRLLFNNVS